MTPDETGRAGGLDACDSCGAILKTLRNVEHFRHEERLVARHFDGSCSCGEDKGWDDPACRRCHPSNSMCVGCSRVELPGNSSLQLLLDVSR